MKILISIFTSLFSLYLNALPTEIIQGVEGTMDGTGQHMVFISMVSEITQNGQTYLELHNCSASIINSNTVMTASHCFGMNPTDIAKIKYANIYFSLDINKDKSVFFTTRKFKTHPDFNTKKDYLNNDIALLHFDQKLPRGYRPAEYQKEDDTLLLGHEFRTAGYGQRYDHSNPIAHTDLSVGKLMSTKLIFDTAFPSPDFFPHHISAQQTQTGICNGDSGGAAFIKTPQGGFKVVGINSSTGTDKSCLDGKSYYTRVFLFKDWIAQTLNEFAK